MKRALIAAALSLGSLGATATTKHESKPEPYRVVFDLSTRDSLDQRAALRWVREVIAADSLAEVEVVMYGKGFELAVPERSAVAAEVQQAVQNPRVSFKVCEVAMSSNKIDRTQLAAGVQTVPDGLREIITKQQQHWGYIKVVAH